MKGGFLLRIWILNLYWLLDAMLLNKKTYDKQYAVYLAKLLFG